MNLRNLSVGLRLGASFGAILLITALLAATGMWRIASLHGASERVATQEIEQQTERRLGQGGGAGVVVMDLNRNAAGPVSIGLQLPQAGLRRAGVSLLRHHRIAENRAIRHGCICVP